jgi:protein-disulfide isomerase
MFRAVFVLLALACAFLAAVPPRLLGASEMAPEQRRAIEEIIHDYLMQNPDVLIEALREAEAKDRKLRFVYKELPVLGAQSDMAAHAALAARLQGKYEPFHTAMMGIKGQLTDEVVYRIAGSIGLDVDRLKRDMTDPEIDQALNANKSLANALDIRGTPGFIIGDHIVPGAIDLEALKNMVADARKQ